jgi:C4-dicarboxylate transporter, DctQ subunit
MLKKLDDFLEKIEKFIIIILFASLLVLMSVNILQRNLLDQSSLLIQESLPIMVMWLSLMGASLALKDGKHISMELLLRFMPQHTKGIMHRLAAAFGCLVMLMGLYLSKTFLASEITIFGVKGYLSIIIPIFFATGAFRFLVLSLYPLHQTKQQ